MEMEMEMEEIPSQETVSLKMAGRVILFFFFLSGLSV